MPSANIIIQSDAEVMKEAGRMLSEPGLTMTSAASIFLRAVVRENGMPFSIKPDVPNAGTAAAIEEGWRIADAPQVRGCSDISALRKSLGA